MKPLPYLFLIAFVIIACSDEQTPNLEYQMQLDKEKESISFMSMSEKYEYLTKHLKTIRNGFLEVANDDDFKTLLNSEIEKRFDGDDNVLLKVLEERSPIIF